MGRKELPFDAPPPIDYSKQRFGRWKVEKFAGRRKTGNEKKKILYWHCRCVCGNRSQVQQRHLLNGNSTQCKACQIRKKATIHGRSKTDIYAVWKNIRRKHKDNMFSEWVVIENGKGLKLFAKHVGKRPTADHKLKRINLTLGWIPGNVHWVHSPAKTYTMEGIEYTVAELAFIANMKLETMRRRLETLSAEDAVACALRKGSKSLQKASTILSHTIPIDHKTYQNDPHTCNQKKNLVAL